MKRSRLAGLIILSFLCLGLACERAEALFYARWIDAANPSPVLRPASLFSIAKNGLVSADGISGSVTERLHRVHGRSVLWSVRSKEKRADANWGALVRVNLPTYAIGKAVGVRASLYTERACDLSLDAYTKVEGPDFYGAVLMGSKKIALRPGRTEITALFSDIVQDVSKVQGVGFSVGPDKLPVDIGFISIDLAFADQVTALDVEQLPHRTSVRWLSKRGVNIGRLVGKLPHHEMERRIWQATHLIAMREQIDYWSRLAARYGRKNPAGPKLLADRRRLVLKLERGMPVAEEAARLQRRIDAFVDGWMSKLSVRQRRFYLAADGRFHYPDGRPYRMFGPHMHRLDFYVPLDSSWIPWDIRHIAAIGFTGIRFVTGWDVLEPTRGRLDPARVAHMRRLARECERYGLGLSVDLHFMRPEWFVKGPPGLENDTTQPAVWANGYHWPEAIARSWGLFAKAIRDCPNTVAWEVPCNEPLVVSGPKGLVGTPALVKSWNQWLKRTYGTREALREAWAHSASGDRRFELADDEDWSRDSIRWMVVEDKPDVYFNYAYNPRLWDHLRWIASLQIETTDLIMQAIREHVPEAMGVMHHTIGDHWDGSPVPLDYNAIETSRGKHVLPGTHYGMGTICALRAAAQSLAGYDTEQTLQGMWPMVKQHVSFGLGLCPFWYSSGGYWYEPILNDEYGHLREDTAYLAENAHWIRSYWPEKKRGVRNVALILNTRLEATRQGTTGTLASMLHSLGCSVGHFDALEVARRPKLLAGYDAAITPSSYLDPELLSVLKSTFRGRVLLYGSLDVDAYGRAAEYGAARSLVQNGVLLRSPTVGTIPLDEKKLDLVGEWDFVHLLDKKEAGSTPPAEPTRYSWIKMPAPAYWNGTGLPAQTGRRNVVGDAWYRRQFVIPADWKNLSLYLQIGGIDDLDWAFLNGTLIGSTDESVINAYAVARSYAVPFDAVRWGEINELCIRVRNTAGDGGIVRGPLALVAQPRFTLNGFSEALSAEDRTVLLGGRASLVAEQALRDQASVLAYVERDSRRIGAAFVRQGRWFWWIGDTSWTGKRNEYAVLKTVLGLGGEGPD